MKLQVSAFLTSKIFIQFLYRIVRIYSWTFRLTIENERPWLDYVNAGGKILMCCWHQQFFSFIRNFQKFKHLRPSIMISQSRDGEIVAGVAKLTGWHVVRGSSSKNGHNALRQMIHRLRTTRLAAHIVDGPKGPAGFVKRGVIRLAQDAGAMIVPVYAIAKNAWYFNSWAIFFTKTLFKSDYPIWRNDKIT